MLTIGIDVGLTGALATLDEQGEVRFVADLPVSTIGKTRWINGGEFLRLLFAACNGSDPARVIVEQTHATPKLGVSTAHAMGQALGSVVAILQVAELSFETVPPAKWKRALGLLAPGTTDQYKKSASLDRARQLFPKARLDRVKDHNRAEAMLVAHYAQRFLYAPDLLGDKAA
jgi:crossover junction endodeoxyribonuclease RuvC